MHLLVGAAFVKGSPPPSGRGNVPGAFTSSMTIRTWSPSWTTSCTVTAPRVVQPGGCRASHRIRRWAAARWSSRVPGRQPDLLDGHGAAQQQVLGAPDDAHAALAEWSVQRIAADQHPAALAHVVPFADGTREAIPIPKEPARPIRDRLRPLPLGPGQEPPSSTLAHLRCDEPAELGLGVARLAIRCSSG